MTEVVNIEAQAFKKALAECQEQVAALLKDQDKLFKERTEMIDDLSYLNKMCITLMSLLPEDTTPEDIKAAMESIGSKVRE